MTPTAAPTSCETAPPRSRAWRPPGAGAAYPALAGLAITAYILARVVEGLPATIFELVGVGACGWAWLAARALFERTPSDARWPLVVGLLVAGSGALSVLAPADGLTERVAGNLYALVGSGALLLTFVEPLAGYRRSLPAVERRFRIAFVGVYGLLVAVAVLGLRSSAEGLQDGAVKAACAVVGLGGLFAAVRFRTRHPLAADPPQTARRPPTSDDHELAGRLTRLLVETELETEPDLRIGEVAARLGVPEYRVSQCIGAALGFANFNRWINHHRIARARRLLTDPADERTILEIAFDCGFGSLGPFNRAFRDEVGMTPRAYRAAARKRKA